MKRSIQFVFAFLLLMVPAFGQFNSHDGHSASTAELTAGTFSYSTQHNPQLNNPSLTNQFEFVFGSPPASTSITITPYMRGGTATGAATTSAVTGSQVLTVTGLADYYVITVSWTGSPGSVSVNITGVLTSLIRKTGTGAYTVSSSSASPTDGCAQFVSGNLASGGTSCGSTSAPLVNPSGGQNNYAPLAGPTFSGNVYSLGTSGTDNFISPNVSGVVGAAFGVNEKGSNNVYGIPTGSAYIGVSTSQPIYNSINGNPYTKISVNGGFVVGNAAYLIANNPSVGVFSVQTGIKTGTSSNTDLNGVLTLSAGTASYTFTGTYTSSPICVASDDTAVAAVRVLVSSTVLTVTGTGTDAVSYICVGRN